MEVFSAHLLAAVASNPDSPKQGGGGGKTLNKNNGIYKIAQLIRIARVHDNCALVQACVYH